MQRIVLVLAILAPSLLVASYVLYYPYVIVLQGASRSHLANDIGATSLVTPLLALVAAWVVGIVDTARRGMWGWLALVLFVPFLGSLIYGAAAPREASAPLRGLASSAAVVLAVLALASLLASIIIPATGLSADSASDRRLLDIFALALGVLAGIVGLVASYRSGRRGWAAMFLVLSLAGLAQLALGATYPPNEALPEGNVPGLTQTFFGIAAAEPLGYLTTLALALALAVVALVYAFRSNERVLVARPPSLATTW